jgi:hypothetical protein
VPIKTALNDNVQIDMTAGNEIVASHSGHPDTPAAPNFARRLALTDIPACNSRSSARAGAQHA